MNLIPEYRSYRKWFFAGLVVQLVAAWFSIGYNQCDEHFQVLEFCNNKLGLSRAADLPWEFAARCRPALQPFIAYILCKALQWLHLYNPFFVSYILRLLTGICTWLVTVRLVVLLLPQFVTNKGRLAFVWCSFLLWFVPYDGVRFTSEHISGLMFFLGLSLLPGLLSTATDKRYLRLIVASLLLGCALYVRPQLVFAIAGLGLWLACYAKWRFKDWLLLVLPALVSIGICLVVDRWFYGGWVLSPYNYFYYNIMQHKAASFGTTPWWQYFPLFLDIVIPPISYVLLPLFLAGLWKNPRHVFSWIGVAFIAGHCMIGHKEMRFLLPIVPAFIFLACKGIDMLVHQYPGKKLIGKVLSTVAVLNTIMLTIKILIPAHEAFKYYKVIYDYAQKQPTTLVCFEHSPYHIVGQEVNFYKPINMDIVIIHNSYGLDSVLKHAAGKSVLFLNPKMDAIPMIAGYKKEKIYCLLPEWVHSLNFYDWIERSYIWSLYRLR